MVVQVYIQTCEGGWKFACKLAREVESLHRNLRGGVESLRADFRWKLGKNQLRQEKTNLGKEKIT